MKMSKSQYDQYQTYRQWLSNQIYTSTPVDILTFISDPQYLGNSFDGGKTLFPCWKPGLRDIFYNDEKYLVVLTGSTGCLGAKVKIKLLDGRSLTIPEIMKEREEGNSHWVYSYD